MDSYRAGKKIANVLDGSGIRVSDISQTQHVINKCIITEPAGEKSITAKALIDYFHCDYKTGSTDLYDILFELGDLEKVWN
jgi:hypothetical protein